MLPCEPPLDNNVDHHSSAVAHFHKVFCSILNSIDYNVDHHSSAVAHINTRSLTCAKCETYDGDVNDLIQIENCQIYDQAQVIADLMAIYEDNPLAIFEEDVVSQG